jgi:Cu/Ag efflux protein CusF
MNKLRQAILIATAVSMAAVAVAQKTAEKKSYVFHGKVESVDKPAKSLSVNNEKIEGWMEAMTMLYPVDDLSVLDKLKPGDQITATVYDGDYSLHDIKLVPASAAPVTKDAGKAKTKK